jgi:hypothetical protein
MAQELRVASCILATPHPNLPLLVAACISDLQSIKIGRLLLYYYTLYIGATVHRCYYISAMRLTAASISDLKSIKIVYELIAGQNLEHLVQNAGTPRVVTGHYLMLY